MFSTHDLQKDFLVAKAENEHYFLLLNYAELGLMGFCSLRMETPALSADYMKNQLFGSLWWLIVYQNS